MLYRIPELIEHVSSIMTLEEGDLILTGEAHTQLLLQ
jgi:acylpyruvate hydrolase